MADKPEYPVPNSGHPAGLIRVLACCAVWLTLSACAPLAISLAGAGAGAGFSHQMNGEASRTFSAPFDKVDAAARMATKRMSLQIDEVATVAGGQITRARVKDLDIRLELEVLSPNLTRTHVTARQSLFRVDAATAKEIVVQIERALSAIEQSEALEAIQSSRQDSASNARFIPGESYQSRRDRGNGKAPQGRTASSKL
ncbi:MAG: DUF3568 family protein [Uliginosibacterium sp.]|nr:DUF3568 family protein [Uliginosibacterium sp.]